ncbi:MAG: hypothetical protein GXP48_03420 [Acidobacteria bacterium]|nr:hypothetical protein [Acidobacteriota bacterium]
MSGETVILVASSDDYLLEEAVAEEAARLSERLGGAPIVPLADEMAPETAATELTSPSLFEPRRVLVMADARAWVDARTPSGAPAVTAMDAGPLVNALEAGVPEDVGLVLGVWAGAKPSGPLVKAVARAGRFRWIPVPPAPKPWEDVVLSREQVQVLEGVVVRAGGDVSFEPGAQQLLLERLGFAPRLLAQEVRKLSAAAGVGGRVDEALVRRLTFPAQRSLDGVRDAVLGREPAPIVDLVAAAEAGVPVRDWRGQPLPIAVLPAMLFGQAFNLFEQLLYLRRAVAVLGASDEIVPARTSSRQWYAQRFKVKGGLGERLLAFIADDASSPFSGKKKPPSVWSLSKLVEGAGKYGEAQLVGLLAGAGQVEAAIRRESGLNALLVWLIGALSAQPA